MGRVVVLGTGGTIATRTRTGGGTQATDMAADLLKGLRELRGVSVSYRDVFVVNSFRLTPTDMAELARETRRTLEDPEVVGIVVTHGTDTLEEAAYFTDLFHTDVRPIVFTGAQHTADSLDPDGPKNLLDALALASDEQSRGLGVLVVFDGEVHRARGVRKVQTLRLNAFGSPETGPLGYMEQERFVPHHGIVRSKPLNIGTLNVSGVRVDIVPYYPGVDTTALRAVVGAGSRGVVIEATGAGNANPEFVDMIDDFVQSGIIVGITTRVYAGPVAAIYGDGGGADLLGAGAILLGTLRASQARMLMIALIGTLGDPQRVRQALIEQIRTDQHTQPLTHDQ